MSQRECKGHGERLQGHPMEEAGMLRYVLL